ncbi:MAG: hypothetical protein Q8N84_00660 [bacterium]|nr:hypothetical protein [bacterium]
METSQSEILPQSQSLPQLNLPSREIFEKYLTIYQDLLNYKKLLNSLIKFNQMYQPIPRGDRQIDPWGHLAGINEERQVRRAQVYLNEKDLIQTFDDKSGKRLVVTSRGHKIFYEDYPLAQLRRKKWDGWWTVVMYDFPEKERAVRRMIRRRLMALGFGCPQISLMVSPLSIDKPIQQLMEGEKVAEKVWTLRAKRILGMENWEVVMRSWPQLAELNRLYDELLEAIPDAKKESSLVEEWRAYFVAVSSTDPYLPAELLPKDWSGWVCEQEFLKFSTGGFLRSMVSKLTSFPK